MMESEDIAYEEDLQKTPYSFKSWWYYLEFKAHAKPESRFMIYERALRSLPRSYKLWYTYLQERVEHVRPVCITDVAYEKVNACFERALVHMNKMPRIWSDYLKFLISQHKLTLTRTTFDRCLKALPVTQHLKWVWPLYLEFAKASGVPETAQRVYKRYLQIVPGEREDYIVFLKKSKFYKEAAIELSKLVNDERFVSQQGKSKHDLWTELLKLITRNPKDIGTSLNVDAIIRSGN